ncbi:MAG: hypothetical protein K0R18_2872 [Bacillales bacterium]|jgi:murein DD-endopeptidase MepM/ murein hydrolase activator NlpD|nr:hypothetical protein [Bacillales bacterium]
MKYFEQLGYTQSSNFGWRSLNGESDYHRGIDIYKADKSRVDAFIPGTVRHAKFGTTGSGLGGYGNCVAIEDKYGKLHIYGHLNSISVVVGQTVSKGQQIGTQGNTGKSYGSHLHYEVRKNASPSYGYSISNDNVVEPTQYIIDYYTKEQPVTPTVSFYPKSSYTGTSIVKALILLGIDSTFNKRKKIAARNGISGYKGSASQNTKMLNLLKAGKLIK